MSVEKILANSCQQIFWELKSQEPDNKFLAYTYEPDLEGPRKILLKLSLGWLP